MAAPFDVIGWLADKGELKLCECGHEHVAHHSDCCECPKANCQVEDCKCRDFVAAE